MLTLMVRSTWRCQQPRDPTLRIRGNHEVSIRNFEEAHVPARAAGRGRAANRGLDTTRANEKAREYQNWGSEQVQVYTTKYT